MNHDDWCRQGRFMLDERDRLLLNLNDLCVLGEVFIVRCEHHWNTNSFEYLGVSVHFDEIPKGERPPEYRLVRDDPRGPFTRFERVNQPKPQGNRRIVVAPE